MGRRWWTVLALALSLGVLGAACSSNDTGTTGKSTEGTGGSTTIEGVQANLHGSASISGKSELELEADDEGGENYFNPTVVSGSAGQTVDVTVKNEGSAEHSFTVDALGIDKDIEPGQEVTVSVKLPQSGALTFHCKYHKTLGMVGEFKVG
jgi:plastocyanin